MGSCCGTPSNGSTQLSPPLLGVDQPHLMLSTVPGGLVFLKRYYHAGDAQPHPGTLTVAVHADGRTVSGAGRDDVAAFTVHGRLVALGPSNVWLLFDKRYTGGGASHAVQYSGQCVDVAAGVFVGQWTIAGGWCGAGTWDMTPMAADGSALNPYPALTVTDMSAHAAQPAQVYRLDATV